MDYQSYLEGAFRPGLMVNTKFKLGQLFNRFYRYEETDMAKRRLYLHALAGGDVNADFPYSARLLLKSCAIVIRCRKGGVRISDSRKNWQITAGSFVSLDFKGIERHEDGSVDMQGFLELK